MATLTGNSIASTYKDLLQVSNSNAGVDATLRTVDDGEGTASALSISSAAIQVDNIKLDGNTITSEDTNGNITLTPNGTGYTVLNGNVGIGTASPDEELEVSGKIHASGGIYSGIITIADDAVGSITPPRQGVLINITFAGNISTPSIGQSGMFYCDTGSSLAIREVIDAASTDTSTSNLTGTTGVDGNVTVGVQSDEIQIENRSEGSRNFVYTFIG
jgi:hypothetical protein